jgi:hypothetical protein
VNASPKMITPRLTPEDVIRNAENYESAWLGWACFWMAIGSLLGAAAALIIVAVATGR